MGYLMRTKNGITFGKQVPAASTERVVYEVDNDVTVESVGARIYRGAENTLELTIEHVPVSGSPTEIVQPVDNDNGKSVIDGDDDMYQWDTSVPVAEGSRIVVAAENTDGSNAHNFRVNMDLDYLGGVERAARSLAELAGVV